MWGKVEKNGVEWGVIGGQICVERTHYPEDEQQRTENPEYGMAPHVSTVAGQRYFLKTAQDEAVCTMAERGGYPAPSPSQRFPFYTVRCAHT